ncbi:MAG: SPOR domain-containing protein [Chloroflexota bacterium]|nr:SPOR domain-containing protein [Lentimicrobium sp.]
MLRIITILLFLLLASSVKSQNEQAELIQDKRVDLLVDKHVFLNRHQFTLTGWRIQIFFDSGANSKRKASEALKLFNERYPETDAYLSFKEPYYRVRVGDFRTRLEAEGFLRKVQAQYPNAFATNDYINPPPIE